MNYLIYVFDEHIPYLWSGCNTTKNSVEIGGKQGGDFDNSSLVAYFAAFSFRMAQ